MPKILVVEDDSGWEKILRQHLSGLQGIVETCTNSEDAISEINNAIRLNAPYDAYILDTMFPKKRDGLLAYESPLELIEEMKGKGIKSERIFVIGYIFPDFMQKAQSLGVRNFYFKEKKSRVEGQKHYTQIRADLATILRN